VSLYAGGNLLREVLRLLQYSLGAGGSVLYAYGERGTACVCGTCRSRVDVELVPQPGVVRMRIPVTLCDERLSLF